MERPELGSVLNAIYAREYSERELGQIYHYVANALTMQNTERFRERQATPTVTAPFTRVILTNTVRPKEIAGATGIYLRGVGRQNYRGQWTSGLIMLDENEAYGKFTGGIVRVNPQALTMEKIT